MGRPKILIIEDEPGLLGTFEVSLQFASLTGIKDAVIGSLNEIESICQYFDLN